MRDVFDKIWLTCSGAITLMNAQQGNWVWVTVLTVLIFATIFANKEKK